MSKKVLLALRCLGIILGYILFGGRLFHSKPRIAILTKDTPTFNDIITSVHHTMPPYFKAGCDVRIFLAKGVADQVEFHSLV